MKVVHLNTNIDKSSAPYKLHEALLQSGIESIILTLNEANLKNVVAVKKTIPYKVKRKIFAVQRNRLLKRYSPQEYMPLSIHPIGIDISRNHMIQDADIIMLHWVCGDYMSPKTIETLLKLGKPVYWTCHDNDPFTGGCHVRLGCEKYKTGCGDCPQLGSDKKMDATRKLYKQKQKLSQYKNLHLLSPSSWMDGNVSQSVFQKNRHFILPNAIDTTLFAHADKKACKESWKLDKDRFTILVGLKANEKIPYNGTEYIWKVFDSMSKNLDWINTLYTGVQVVVFGVKEFQNRSKLDIINAGYIKEQQKLASLYAAADLYLVTSLEDSFNQTVAECMACGTPVVAFNNGGIADIIDHKENGYLAKYKDQEDLVEGIQFLAQLQEKEKSDISRKACEKIQSRFSYEVIKNKFVEIMNNN